MTMKSSSKFASVAITACVLCTTPAWAGFQWTPPAAPLEIIEAPAAPAPTAAPSVSAPTTVIEGKAQDNSDIGTPIVIEGTVVAPAAPVPAPKVAPIAIAPQAEPAAVSAPVQITPKPELQATAPAADVEPQEIAVAPPAAAESVAPPPAPAAEGVAKLAAPSVVRGFANRVPLTVALRQLLPAAYSFSVDQDVDMGVLVSFKGGKPWRETLTSSLQAVGLVPHEQAQMVVISRIVDASTPAAVASTVPPAIVTPAANQATDANPVVFDNVPAPSTTKPLEIATSANVEPEAPAAVVMPAIPVVPPADTKVAVKAEVAPAPVAPAHPARVAPVSSLPAPVPAPAPVPSAPIAAEAEGTLVMSSSVASEPVKVAEMWTADRGDSLRKVLTSWSHRAHVELEWLAEYDYPLQASVNLTGSYEDAVRNLLTGFEGAQPQPVAQLHANAGAGQKVLVVRARGNTNKD